MEFRGFSKKQVLEHVELLEGQLRLIAIDRDEASKLNVNCRQVCDDLRRELDEARGRLARIESSTSKLPQAAQGIQNMLLMAEAEADAVRQRAERYAETARGIADTDARQIRADAEAEADALRAECEKIVVELETRRDQINAEHSQKVDALHARHQELRLAIQQEYEETMARARADTEELLAETGRHCAELEEHSQQRRTEAYQELDRLRDKVDRSREALVVMLSSTRSTVDEAVATLAEQGTALRSQSEQIQQAETDDRERVRAQLSESAARVLAGSPEVPSEAEPATDDAERVEDDAVATDIPLRHNGSHPSTNGGRHAEHNGDSPEHAETEDVAHTGADGRE